MLLLTSSLHSSCFAVVLLSSFLIRVEAICFEEECKQFVQPEVVQTDLQEEDRATEDDVQARHHIMPKNTLQQIHVVFRHGDRTPDSFYPKDPNINFTFYPVGLKELTNEGKRREFQVGLELREAYDRLLGPYYLPEIIEARSSAYNRTKMSLQLVLASLYPPQGKQVWLNGFDWQPIPTYYIDSKNDNVFLQIQCPSFGPAFAGVLQLPELQAQVAKFSKWYEFLAQNTGMTVTSPFTMFEIYWTLRTEEEYGLDLPSWTKSIYPEPLTSLAKEFYILFAYNQKMKKVTTGGLVTTIIDNILSKKSGQNKYRIQLYSGHEINVAGLLRTLDVFEPHVPNYGSHVILEVHKIGEQHFIKIIHQANEGYAPKILTMPNCATLCPLDEFINILRPFMVDWNNPCLV